MPDLTMVVKNAAGRTVFSIPFLAMWAPSRHPAKAATR